MPTVPQIHQRGTRAGQPAATTVTVGTLYFVTDEGKTERATGSAWESYSAPAGGGPGGARIGAVGLIIDGGGSVITTGVKGFVEVPFAGTITAVTLLSTDAAATAGSIVVDIWKDTYAAYPPVVSDSITASAKPTLSAANKARDTTLTGWTTAIAAGDVLGFSVTSATTVTRVLLSLTVQAT
jgi:hypothetical protein